MKRPNMFLICIIHIKSYMITIRDWSKEGSLFAELNKRVGAEIGGTCF